MKTKTNDVWVTTTEEFILNYAALPKEFEDWRYYRIEYYGDGPYAIKECSFFAPPWFDRDTFEKLFVRPKKWNEIPNRWMHRNAQSVKVQAFTVVKSAPASRVKIPTSRRN